MKIDFKPYSPKDKTDVLEMMTAFNEIDGYDFDSDMGEKNLIQFTSNEGLGRLYLIQNEGQNVGYIVLAFGFSFEYQGRDAFIDEFFIQEGYRKQGIGNLAMDFVESEARKFNIMAIHLEVEPHNENARHLYLNKGYQSGERTLMTKCIEPNTSDR